MARLLVSVITPTYNRRNCFAAAIDCYLAQTYPLTSREWIILEDGHESVADLLVAAQVANPDLKVRYIRSEEKMTIGAKRNRLNDEAAGDIIIAWDDDDYYPPERIQHTVQRLMASPRTELAGSSAMYIYFQDDASIWLSGPFAPNHATNGTLAYVAAYARRHRYDETVRFAEERSFLDEYSHPLIQLDPRKTILCIAHKENTFMKDGIRTGNTAKKTSLTLKDFIRKAATRASYIAA
jgi:glycosyltransferase involved in cell wall biosynthesis